MRRWRRGPSVGRGGHNDAVNDFVSPEPEPASAPVRVVSGTIAAAAAPGPGGASAAQVAALFLLTYKPTTASAYAVDLRQWFAWCALFDVDPFEAARAHVDAWAVHLADGGRARPATLARKISAVRNFYA